MEMEKVKIACKNFKLLWQLERINYKLQKSTDFSQNVLEVYEKGKKILEEATTLPAKTQEYYKDLFYCIYADVCWSSGQFKEMIPVTQYLLQHIKVLEQKTISDLNIDLNDDFQISKGFLSFRKFSAQYLDLKQNNGLNLENLNEIQKNFNQLSQESQQDKNSSILVASHLAKAWIAFDDKNLEKSQKEINAIEELVHLKEGFEIWAEWINFLTEKMQNQTKLTDVENFLSLLTHKFDFKVKNSIIKS